MGETIVSTLLRSAVLAGVLAAPLAAVAAAPAPAGKTPTLSDVLGASGIAAAGVVDFSYDWSDVDGGPVLRSFDVEDDGFSLHQVNLLASKSFDNGFGVTLNPIFGDDAALIGPNGDDFDLTQAFISYGSGPVTLIGGRFTTLAGYEVINPSGNLNASRSLLFFLQPFLHTGVRGTVKASDALSFSLGVNNGVAFGKTDNNTDQTVEAQVALTTGALSLYVTGYTGNEDAAPGPGGGAVLRSDTVDVVASLALGDAVTVAVNGDYFATEDGAGGTLVTKGVAGYANVKFGAFRIAPRVEYVEFDANPGTAWARETTLTFGYACSENLELLAEARNDEVDTGEFGGLPPRDVTDPTPNNDQTTATLKAVFKF